MTPCPLRGCQLNLVTPPKAWQRELYTSALETVVITPARTTLVREEPDLLAVGMDPGTKSISHTVSVRSHLYPWPISNITFSCCAYGSPSVSNLICVSLALSIPPPADAASACRLIEVPIEAEEEQEDEAPAVDEEDAILAGLEKVGLSAVRKVKPGGLGKLKDYSKRKQEVPNPYAPKQVPSSHIQAFVSHALYLEALYSLQCSRIGSEADLLTLRCTVLPPACA